MATPPRPWPIDIWARGRLTAIRQLQQGYGQAETMYPDDEAPPPVASRDPPRIPNDGAGDGQPVPGGDDAAEDVDSGYGSMPVADRKNDGDVDSVGAGLQHAARLYSALNLQPYNPTLLQHTFPAYGSGPSRVRDDDLDPAM